jgi:hypothetical protein
MIFQRNRIPELLQVQNWFLRLGTIIILQNGGQEYAEEERVSGSIGKRLAACAVRVIPARPALRRIVRHRRSHARTFPSRCF